MHFDNCVESGKISPVIGRSAFRRNLLASDTGTAKTLARDLAASLHDMAD